MDKFIAINVNQGDAFYLERSCKKILVDGGRSRLGFPVQFERVVGNEALDVVVCTHADADHINGLIGFYESGLKSKEIWLPGTWTSRLGDLLKQPRQFFDEVIESINEQNLGDVRGLEDYYEKKELFYRDKISAGKEEGEINISELYEAVEASQDLFPLFYNKWFLIDFWPYRSLENYGLIVDAIDTATKIRDLAVLAYHAGARIRWFQYQKRDAISGGEAFLKPANSTEIMRIRKHISALEYLALSKANKESLVFYSPGNDSSGDVLFCADSDLSFQQPLPSISQNSIITSPHHGSEHNRCAYERLDKHGYLSDKSIVVRSDGRFIKRPGETYKRLKLKRICTLCRHPEAEGQNIVFTSAGKGWRKKNGLAWCHCI